jgi:hypothetical protein
MEQEKGATASNRVWRRKIALHKRSVGKGEIVQVEKSIGSSVILKKVVSVSLSSSSYIVYRRHRTELEVDGKGIITKD